MKVLNILSGILNIFFALFWIVIAILVVVGMTFPPIVIFCGLLITALSYIELALIDFLKK